jgi:hypothetical protein
MKPVQRFDRGLIQKVDEKDGFLRARVSIARVGVFPYLYHDGQIRHEAKLPEDLFSEITINTAKGSPVTDGHVPVAEGGKVTPVNYNKYVKGSLGDEAIVKEDHIWLNETVYDRELIEDIKSGKKVEVSIGFDTILDSTPGEFRGQKYDARQTNIKINHLAHVEAGRGGESVRVHLDGADLGPDTAVMVGDNEDKTSKRSDSKMNEFLELLKKLVAALTGGKEEPQGGTDDPAKGEIKEEPQGGAAEPAKGDAQDKQTIKVLTAKVDALEAALKKFTDKDAAKEATTKLDEAVKARISLIETAKSVCPDLKHDGMTDRDIKLAVIGKILPYDSGVKVDSLEDVYINARYDAAMSLAREKAAIGGEQGSRFDAKAAQAEIEKKREARLNMNSDKK